MNFGFSPIHFAESILIRAARLFLGMNLGFSAICSFMILVTFSNFQASVHIEAGYSM